MPLPVRNLRGLRVFRRTLAWSTPFARNLHSNAGLAHLSHRRVISISGQDAPRLLQGLISNTVLQPPERAGFYSAFLTAQGRILADSFIYRDASARGCHDSFLIEVDQADASNLLGYLNHHKLASQIDLRLVDEYQVWAGWTTSDTLNPSDLLTEDVSNNSSSTIRLHDPRVPGFSLRALVRHGNRLEDVLPEKYASLPSVDLDSYMIRRYLYGIAEGHRETLSGRCLPHEFNFDLLNAIDFKKGCYIGQELTIRTQHTGVVRKRVLPVQLYPSGGTMPLQQSYSPESTHIKAQNIPRDLKIKLAGERRSRGAGKWITGTGNIGLAICRLEMMTDIRVSSDDGISYTDGAEFELDGPYKQVKVKAFVPHWLRTRLASSQAKDGAVNGIDSIRNTVPRPLALHHSRT